MSIEQRVSTIVWDAYQMYSGKPNTAAENPFPMYSYDNPTPAFWRGFIRQLCKDGLEDEQIVNLLQSKHMRWMFDSDSAQIEKLGESMAQGFADIAMRL